MSLVLLGHDSLEMSSLILVSEAMQRVACLQLQQWKNQEMDAKNDLSGKMFIEKSNVGWQLLILH